MSSTESQSLKTTLQPKVCNHNNQVEFTSFEIHSELLLFLRIILHAQATRSNSKLFGGPHVQVKTFIKKAMWDYEKKHETEMKR